MSDPDAARHVEVRDGDQIVAAAEVTTARGPEGTARTSLHATSPDVPAGHRANLVDAVMDSPEVQASTRLEATIPLGDSELLERLRQRTHGRGHPSGRLDHAGGREHTGRSTPWRSRPSTPRPGETLKTFDEMSEADVERCLAAAATAHASYRLTSFAERAGWMRSAASILDKEQDQIAAMMTTEMGKTLAAARQEVAKCARACRYYAEHAAGSWPTSPPTPAPWAPRTPTSATSRSGRCWPSCPGTSRSGRRCASPPRP